MQKMPPELFFVEPMECKAVEKLPDDPEEWQYEIKFDGYRSIAIKQHGDVRLFSRNGNSFDAAYPAVAEAIVKLRAKSFVLDGELVAINAEGRHSFALLQHRAPGTQVYYYVFDLLHLDGKELRGLSLQRRRSQLEQAFPEWPKSVRLSPLLTGALSAIEANIRDFQFEGIVAKQKRAPYLSGEAPGTWIKHKIQRTEDFVVGGYIPGPHGVDQLLVGKREQKNLLFVESIKNGFVPATRRLVEEAIKHLQIDACPFSNLPEKKRAHAMDRDKMKKVRWLAPKVDCEVAFNEWTPNQHLRHARFIRLKETFTRRKNRVG
jgi:DNA ligase D-like protein (predicted ligase)